MRIRVRLFGTLRRFSQPETPGLWTGDVPPGTTLAGFFDLMGIDSREVAVSSINGERSSLDAEIPVDSEVLLVTHVGGG